MSRKYASSAAAASTIHSKFASAFHWACLARRHGLPAAHRRSVSERPHGNSSRSRLGLQRAVAVAVAVKVVKRKLSARNGWRRMSMSRALLSPMLSGQLAPPVGATYHRVQAVELELELELVCPARHVMERQPCPLPGALRALFGTLVSRLRLDGAWWPSSVTIAVLTRVQRLVPT